MAEAWGSRAQPAAAATLGIALVTDDQKLMRESSWRRTGTDPRGLDLWTIEFE